MKKCSKCKIEKSINDFSKDKNKKDGLQHRCKDCNKDYFKKYYINNKEHLLNKFCNYRICNKDNRKKYVLNNREKINKNRREYFKNRKKTDLIFKFKCNIRTLIKNSFKRIDCQRKSNKSEKILGCTFEEFKIHIEKQFTEGMSWSNQGEWYLDHIKPLALAKTKEDVIQLNHYTNFQPLWAEENWAKGSKYYSLTNLPTLSTYL